MTAARTTGSRRRKSAEGIATALLNVCLDMSGAVRGAAVLSAKGELTLGQNGFAPGLPLIAKLKPQGELTGLPLDVLRAVVVAVGLASAGVLAAGGGGGGSSAGSTVSF